MEEDVVSGFFVLSHLWMRGEDEKKEKSYCENTKKPATSFPSFDPIQALDFYLNIQTILLLIHNMLFMIVIILI